MSVVSFRRTKKNAFYERTKWNKNVWLTKILLTKLEFELMDDIKTLRKYFCS